jgi:lipopolysaccharide export system permease protein
MSFWDLPQFIAFFESAGFSANAHRMHWHALLASPVLLCAMVLLAAVFGFNSSQRQGAWLARVVGCAVAGFLVYFFSQVTYTLGQSQTLPVALAAWSPTLVSGLLGTALLFHLEDG